VQRFLLYKLAMNLTSKGLLQGLVQVLGIIFQALVGLDSRPAYRHAPRPLCPPGGAVTRRSCRSAAIQRSLG
jgi:hypothetical protein